MILNQFPDLSWLKNQAEKSFSDRKGWGGRSLPTNGWPNVILNVRTQSICRDHIRGPLSIFTNISGESYVEAENRRVKIKNDFFYVTNHDQYYTLEVDQRKAETFNVHFGEYFSDQVWAALRSKPERLLDENSFFVPFEKVNFHNRLHVKTPAFNRVLSDLQQTAGNPTAMEEKLFELMTLLLKDDTELEKSIHQLPLIKRATRQEIMKRLLHATDLIYAHYDQDLSLDTLAAASCLSKFHFLRLFKLAFNKTPHQFTNDIRATKAKELLKNSKENVVDIAKSLGFRDASTFSRMFYNQVGVYPSQYR